MNNLIMVVLCALAGCTAYSGPTADVRPLENGQIPPKTFEVVCAGLFEETGSCLKKAREFCESEPGSPSVYVLEAGGLHGRSRTRLVFRCDMPARPEPVVVSPAAQLPAKVLLHGDALFDFDRSDLKPAGRRELDAVISSAEGKRFRVVQVSGYTDGIGSDRYNNALSTRRARAVAKYLRERGLLAERLVVTGFGESNPVASNATEEGRTKNRRVELILEQQ